MHRWLGSALPCPLRRRFHRISPHPGGSFLPAGTIDESPALTIELQAHDQRTDSSPWVFHGFSKLALTDLIQGAAREQLPEKTEEVGFGSGIVVDVPAQQLDQQFSFVTVYL